MKRRKKAANTFTEKIKNKPKQKIVYIEGLEVI